MFDFLTDVMAAVIKLGVPVAILSWYLIDRLYQSGHIESGSDFKTVKESVGLAKKDWKDTDKSAGNFFEQRWMKFGGGFYGLTALTTLILIEVKDGFAFVTNFPGIAALFAGGVFGFLVDFIVNQIQNIIMAAIWFTYWNDDNASMFTYIAVAYVGYFAGVTLAGDERLQKLRGQNDAET